MIADKYEARLNSSVVALPVAVTGGETPVVEAGTVTTTTPAPICIKCRHSHRVVAPTPDAAELTHSPVEYRP